MDAFIAGAWRSPGRGEIYIGGMWRRLSRAEAYIGGQWRSIARFVQPLTLSSYDVSGYASGSKPVGRQVTSSLATATPAGGLAPYSYSWAITSGTASISNPTQASTYFSEFVPGDQERVSTARCTCTDSIGSAATVDITVTLTNESQLNAPLF